MASFGHWLQRRITLFRQKSAYNNHYLRRAQLFGVYRQAVQVSTSISAVARRTRDKKNAQQNVTFYNHWLKSNGKKRHQHFLLCVNRPIMDGLKHSFTARWQRARYESDRTEIMLVSLLLLIRLFVVFLSGFVSVAVYETVAVVYTVWCDTLVGLQFVSSINRCKRIKPQIDPSTDSTIKYIKWLRTRERERTKRRQKHTNQRFFFLEKTTFTRSQAEHVCFLSSEDISNR